MSEASARVHGGGRRGRRAAGVCLRPRLGYMQRGYRRGGGRLLVSRVLLNHAAVM